MRALAPLLTLLFVVPAFASPVEGGLVDDTTGNDTDVGSIGSNEPDEFDQSWFQRTVGRNEWVTPLAGPVGAPLDLMEWYQLLMAAPSSDVSDDDLIRLAFPQDPAIPVFTTNNPVDTASYRHHVYTFQGAQIHLVAVGVQRGEGGVADPATAPYRFHTTLPDAAYAINGRLGADGSEEAEVVTICRVLFMGSFRPCVGLGIQGRLGHTLMSTMARSHPSGVSVSGTAEPGYALWEFNPQKKDIYDHRADWTDAPAPSDVATWSSVAGSERLDAPGFSVFKTPFRETEALVPPAWGAPVSTESSASQVPGEDPFWPFASDLHQDLLQELLQAMGADEAGEDVSWQSVFELLAPPSAESNDASAALSLCAAAGAVIAKLPKVGVELNLATSSDPLVSDGPSSSDPLLPSDSPSGSSSASACETLFATIEPILEDAWAQYVVATLGSYLPPSVYRSKLPGIAVYDCDLWIGNQRVGGCREPVWRVGPELSSLDEWNTQFQFERCTRSVPSSDVLYHQHTRLIREPNALSYGWLNGIQGKDPWRWSQSCSATQVDEVHMSWTDLLDGTGGRGRFMDVANAPSAREDPGVFWNGNRVYLIGGKGCGSVCTNVAVYDPATSTAGTVPGFLSPGRHSMATVWTGSRAYLAGGETSTSTVSDIVEYNPTNGIFTTRATMPGPRRDAVAVWDGTHVWIMGGWNPNAPSGGRALTEILKFDPAGGTVSTQAFELPEGRANAAVAWDGTTAYLVGGENEAGALSTVVAITPGEQRVETLAARLSTPMGRGAAATATGHAFVFGSDKYYRFDFATRELLPMPVTPPVRQDAQAVWVNDRAYLVAGACGCGNNAPVTAFLPGVGDLLARAAITGEFQLWADALEPFITPKIAVRYGNPAYESLDYGGSIGTSLSISHVVPKIQLVADTIEVRDGEAWREATNAAQVFGGETRLTVKVEGAWSTAATLVPVQGDSDRITVYLHREPMDANDVNSTTLRMRRGPETFVGGTVIAGNPENRLESWRPWLATATSNVPFVKLPNTEGAVPFLGHWTGDAATVLEACVQEAWTHSHMGPVVNWDGEGAPRLALEPASDVNCVELRNILDLDWPAFPFILTLEVRAAEDYGVHVTMPRLRPTDALQGVEDNAGDPLGLTLGLDELAAGPPPWHPNSTLYPTFGARDDSFALRLVVTLPSSIGPQKLTDASLYLVLLLQDLIASAALEIEDLPLTAAAQEALDFLQKQQRETEAPQVPILVPAGVLPAATWTLDAHDKLFTLNGLAAHPYVITIGGGSTLTGVDPWSRLGPNPWLQPKPDFLAPSPAGTTIGAVLNAIPLVEMLHLSGVFGSDLVRATLASLAIPYTGKDPVHNHYLQGYGVLDPVPFLEDFLGRGLDLDAGAVSDRGARGLQNTTEGGWSFLDDVQGADSSEDVFGLSLPPSMLDPLGLGTVFHLNIDTPLLPLIPFTDWGVTNHEIARPANIKLLDADTTLQAAHAALLETIDGVAQQVEAVDQINAWRGQLLNTTFAGLDDVSIRTNHYFLFDLLTTDYLYGVLHDLTEIEVEDVPAEILGTSDPVGELVDQLGILLPEPYHLVADMDRTVEASATSKRGWPCARLDDVYAYARDLAAFIDAQRAVLSALAGQGVPVPAPAGWLAEKATHAQAALWADRFLCDVSDPGWIIDYLETLRGELQTLKQVYALVPNTFNWAERYTSPPPEAVTYEVLNQTGVDSAFGALVATTSDKFNETADKLRDETSLLIDRVIGLIQRLSVTRNTYTRQPLLLDYSLPSQTSKYDPAHRTDHALHTPLGPYVGLTTVTTHNLSVVNPLTGQRIDHPLTGAPLVYDVTVPIPSLLWNNPTLDVEVEYRDGMPIVGQGFTLHEPDFRVLNRTDIEIDVAVDGITVPLLQHLFGNLGDAQGLVPANLTERVDEVLGRMGVERDEVWGATTGPVLAAGQSADNMTVLLVHRALEALEELGNEAARPLYENLDHLLVELYSKPLTQGGWTNMTGEISIPELFPVESVAKYNPYDYGTRHLLDRDLPYADPGTGDVTGPLHDLDYHVHKLIRQQLVGQDGATTHAERPRWPHLDDPLPPPVAASQTRTDDYDPIEIHDDAVGPYHQFGLTIETQVGDPLELLCLLLRGHNVQFATSVLSPFPCEGSPLFAGLPQLGLVPGRPMDGLVSLLCGEIDPARAASCAWALEQTLALDDKRGSAANLTYQVETCGRLLGDAEACTVLIASYATLHDLLASVLLSLAPYIAPMPFVHSLTDVIARRASAYPVNMTDLVADTASLNPTRSIEDVEQAVQQLLDDVSSFLHVAVVLEEPPRHDPETYLIAQGLKSHAGDKVSGLDWCAISLPERVDNLATVDYVLGLLEQATLLLADPAASAWATSILADLAEMDPAQLAAQLRLLTPAEVGIRYGEDSHVEHGVLPPVDPAAITTPVAATKWLACGPSGEIDLPDPPSPDDPAPLLVSTLNEQLRRLGYELDLSAADEAANGTGADIPALDAATFLPHTDPAANAERSSQIRAAQVLSNTYAGHAGDVEAKTPTEVARLVLSAAANASAWIIDQNLTTIRATSTTMGPKLGVYTYSLPLAPQEHLLLHTDGEYYFQNSDAILIATPYDLVRDVLLAAAQPLSNALALVEDPNERARYLAEKVKETVKNAVDGKIEHRDEYLRIRHLNPQVQVEQKSVEFTGSAIRRDTALARYGGLRVQAATDMFEFYTRGVEENHQFGFDEMHLVYLFFPLLDDASLTTTAEWIQELGRDVTDPSFIDPSNPQSLAAIVGDLQTHVEQTGSKFIIQDFGAMWNTYVGFTNQGPGDARLLGFPSPWRPNVEDLKVYWSIPGDVYPDRDDFGLSVQGPGQDLDQTDLGFLWPSPWLTGTRSWNLWCGDTYAPGKWYNPTSWQPRGVSSLGGPVGAWSEFYQCVENTVSALQPSKVLLPFPTWITTFYNNPMHGPMSWFDYDVNVDTMPKFEGHASGGPIILPRIEPSLLYCMYNPACFADVVKVPGALKEIPTDLVLDRLLGAIGTEAGAVQELGSATAGLGVGTVHRFIGAGAISDVLPIASYEPNPRRGLGTSPSVHYWAMIDEADWDAVTRTDPDSPSWDRPQVSILEHETAREKAYAQPPGPVVPSRHDADHMTGLVERIEQEVGHRDDLDRNRIEDVLDRIVEEVPQGEVLRVLVLFDAPEPLAEAARQVPVLGGLVEQAFHVIPALAVAAPSDAVPLLAGLPGVSRVYHDAIVRATLDSSTAAMDAAQARIQSGVEGAGVGIAILDTGIDAEHPSLDDQDDVASTLDPKVVGWHDVISAKPFPYDDHGHGSHVAHTAAGTSGDTGLVGVAPAAHLVGVKVLSGSGGGSEIGIVAGIQWAVDHKDDTWGDTDPTNDGIHVISMSLGADMASDGDSPMELAATAAMEANLVTVVAAGNAGPEEGTVGVPASAHDIVTVGAVHDSHAIAYFSSRGPTRDGRLKPEVSAPGVAVTAARPGGGTATMDGTSMATPHVAGLVALMLEASDLGYNAFDVREILMTTATDRGEPGPDPVYGHGVVDAPTALDDMAPPLPDDLAVRRILLTPAGPGPGEEASVAIHIRNKGSDAQTNVQVELHEDGVLVATRIVEAVPAKSLVVVTIPWTAPTAHGIYTLRARTVPVQGEERIDDNVRETQVRILRDVAVSRIDGDRFVAPDTGGTMVVQVRNVGVFDAADFEVGLYRGETLLDSMTVLSLPRGTGVHVRLDWTAPGTEGPENLTVRIDDPLDEDPSNDARTFRYLATRLAPYSHHQRFDFSQAFDPGRLVVAGKSSLEWRQPMYTRDELLVRAESVMLDGILGTGFGMKGLAEVNILMRKPQQDPIYGNWAYADAGLHELSLYVASGGGASSGADADGDGNRDRPGASHPLKCSEFPAVDLWIVQATCYGGQGTHWSGNLQTVLNPQCLSQVGTWMHMLTTGLVDGVAAGQQLAVDTTDSVLWPLMMAQLPEPNATRTAERGAQIADGLTMGVNAVAEKAERCLRGIAYVGVGGCFDPLALPACLLDNTPAIGELDATLPRTLPPVLAPVQLDFPPFTDVPLAQLVLDGLEDVVRVTFGATDDLGSVAEYEVTRTVEDLDGQVVSTQTVQLEETSWDQPLEPLLGHWVTYAVRARDDAGHWGPSAVSEPLLVDIEPPAIDLSALRLGRTVLDGLDLGPGAQGATVLGPQDRPASIPITVQATHETYDVEAKSVRVYLDAAEVTGGLVDGTFALQPDLLAPNVVHVLRVVATGHNGLTSEESRAFYFPKTDATAALSELTYAERRAGALAYQAPAGGLAQPETINGAPAVHLRSIGTDAATVSWANAVPSARVVADASVFIDDRTDGRFDVLRVLDGTTTRAALYLDGPSSELRFERAGHAAQAVGDLEIAEGTWRNFQFVLGPQVVDVYVDTLLQGSFAVALPDQGATGLRIGGLGADAYVKNIGLRTLAYRVNSLLSLEPVHDLVWTTTGSGTSTYGTTSMGTVLRVAGLDPGFEAVSPSLPIAHGSHASAYVRRDGPSATETVVFGLRSEAGDEILRITTANGGLYASDGASSVPIGQSAQDEWVRLDLELFGEAYSVRVNQGPPTNLSTTNAATAGRVFVGRGTTPVSVDRVRFDNTDLRYDHQFSSSVESLGWTRAVEATGRVDVKSTGGAIGTGFLEIEGTADGVAYASFPAEPFGKKMRYSAAFRPKGASLDHAAVFAAFNTTGVPFALTLRQLSTSSWSLYLMQDGVGTSVGSSWGGDQWHELVVEVDRYERTVSVVFDETFVSTAQCVDMGEIQRYAVGDVFGVGVTPSGRGRFDLDDVTAVPLKEFATDHGASSCGGSQPDGGGDDDLCGCGGTLPEGPDKDINMS